MKYKDLLQFEPIEDIIQLRDADVFEEAKKLVETYVISDVMSDKLTEIIFKHLQYNVPFNSKGILIVGNYGTGKSHLMSVVSAVAEHKEFALALRNEKVKKAAESIAGKFKVIRIEIGSTTKRLRDFITDDLEMGLADMGVEFNFPLMSEITSNKPGFEDMMAAFHKKYPEHGLLLVVDELLDYLRHRDDQQIVSDLAFLRELGEITRDLRFRFMAGIQEALFDNPRFSAVADSVRRVIERQVEVTITREDIKFVVANRLLLKTLDQAGKIREHLTKFSRFYGNMNERMDEFVDLFPIHPDYITTFERLTSIETRVVLKTVSSIMKEMLHNDVPHDQPGLVSYDQYWSVIKRNPSIRTVQEIRDVYECSHTLEELVKVNYPKERNLEFALRIIHGLSVHRLTVGDIEKPIGLTAENLRDQLCLWDPVIAELGGDPIDDLKGETETTLRQISRAVNGQFISATATDDQGRLGGQFYLDIHKTMDYDARIRTEAETVSPNSLDLAYFDALVWILERSDQYYPGTRLAWEYDLEWSEHQVFRRGYIFFGAPNERNTAQPPRDFYIFFVRPFEESTFKDEKDPRDVFFKLKRRDETFDTWLRYYAACRNLMTLSGGQEKATYERKLKAFEKHIVQWINENMLTIYDVTYQGRTKPLQEYAKQVPSTSEGRNVRDIVNAAAEKCLAPHFANLAPEYPKFRTRISRNNEGEAVMDALENIGVFAQGGLAGSKHTKRGLEILESLELLSEDALRPERSRYSKYILDRLGKKERGHVLNRAEIMETVQAGVEYMAPSLYRLEPHWVSVILASLVFSGHLVLSVQGRKYDASKIDQLTALSVGDLVRFTHMEKPKDWPVPEMAELFELVGLARGLATQVTLGNQQHVRTFQERVALLINQVIETKERVNKGFYVFNKNILEEDEESEIKKRLDSLKSFLDYLTVLSTPAKFKNLNLTVKEINSEKDNFSYVEEVNKLAGTIDKLYEIAAYLSQAVSILPENHEWIEKVIKAQEKILDSLTDEKTRSDKQKSQQLLPLLSTLKEEYINLYVNLHSRARLGIAGDRLKREIIGDGRLPDLDALASILKTAVYAADIRERLGSLKSCFSLTEGKLKASPVCQACNFRPAVEGTSISADLVLDQLDKELDERLAEWTLNLLEMLQDPTVQETIGLMSQEEKSVVEDFLRQKKLPRPVNEEFVRACTTALEGLLRVRVDSSAFMKSLIQSGGPITVAQLKERLEKHVEDLVKGKDPAKVRIVFE